MRFHGDSRICAFASRRTVFANDTRPATLVVKDEKIDEILYDISEDVARYLSEKYPGIPINDCGALVLMPGIIDSHVHVNEPGRTEWEGFRSATQAAAAGGVTTIADMPLNSIPPTTTLDNLKAKAKEAYGKTFVDVAFWGGVIPGNQRQLRSLVDASVVGFKCFLCPSGIDEFPQVSVDDVRKALTELLPTGSVLARQLRSLVDAGVVGFKCFLCPSGVDEFPQVSVDDVRRALTELLPTVSVLAFHAEYGETRETSRPVGDPRSYDTFLRSRPDRMELDAVKLICDWCAKYDFRCHIVHLSSAECLALINDARDRGAPLTVETCYHYLVLTAEEIPEGSAVFKCCPPIRKKSNRERLWDGIKNGTLDMVVSDHSPCVPELKTPDDFLRAWGGISSLQFGLPLIWTAAKTRDLTFPDISRLLSTQPAKLCGLESRKGTLTVGLDADFVIWDPDESIKIEKDKTLYKNKLSPYEGKVFFGKVVATVLRGRFIFKEGRICEKPTGNLLLSKDMTF